MGLIGLIISQILMRNLSVKTFLKIGNNSWSSSLIKRELIKVIHQQFELKNPSGSIHTPTYITKSDIVDIQLNRYDI